MSGPSPAKRDERHTWPLALAISPGNLAADSRDSFPQHGWFQNLDVFAEAQWDLYFANDRLIKIVLWIDTNNPFRTLEEATSLLSKKYGWANRQREFDFPYNLPLKEPSLDEYPSEKLWKAFDERKAHVSSVWRISNGQITAQIFSTEFGFQLVPWDLNLSISYEHNGFKEDILQEEKNRLDEL